MLFPKKPELLPVGVIGERLDHIRSRVDELAVKLADELGMLEDHLRHECAGLEVATPLEFEHIPFGANHRTLCEALEQSAASGRLDVCHPTVSCPRLAAACFQPVERP